MAKERLLAQGNEAVGWGAIGADCTAFFGYPITPQNETTAWFAREFPKRGRLFLQSQSEIGSISMVFGAGAAGVRAMTSTSSPGWALMQEGISHMISAEIPCVIVDVQRGGPGYGTVQHAQTDYLSVTRGGGQGGYKTLTLAPASAQETHDFVQLAFHLADKYRNPTVVLSDAVIGRTMETFEVSTLSFDPLPEKDWALRGKDQQEDGKHRVVSSTQGGIPYPPYDSYLAFMEGLERKFQAMTDAEVRYEEYLTEDAHLILVAYGYPSRISREAINRARDEGLKVGLIRPITVWPFPCQPIREKADLGCRFLVVEDSLGQMIEDVRLAVEGRADIYFLGMKGRHLPSDDGLILPVRVLEEIRRFCE